MVIYQSVYFNIINKIFIEYKQFVYDSNRNKLKYSQFLDKIVHFKDNAF